MCAASSDRRPRALLLALLAALPAAARAEGTADPARPVFFRDPDLKTAGEIRNAIGLFGSPSPNDRERGRNALHEIGYWSVGTILSDLKEMGQQHRSNSFLVLGRLADPRALGPFRDSVRDDAAEWPPVIAALMLGRVRDAEDATLAAFRDALASRQNEKRKVAVALALGKLQRKRSADTGPMLEALADAPSPSPSVRQAALLALGFHRSLVAEATPDGTGYVPSPRMKAALADSREGARLSAILALAISRLDGLEPVFLDAFRTDGDREVRRAALLALGKPRDRPDEAITGLVAGVLENPKSNLFERGTAAYLLMLRKDPSSVEALWRTATAPRSPETAAAALVALGGIDDARVPDLLIAKLGDRSATIRAAAAVAATRLPREEDLRRLRDALKRRLDATESDQSARFDLRLAQEEIGKILKDREDAAKGKVPAPRPAPPWAEADAADLFWRLGRSHREAVLDLANLRVLQVLGIDSMFEYRPFSEPLPTNSGDASSLQGGSTQPGTGSRMRREHSVLFEPYDLAIEFERRPYYLPEDDPEEARPPVPRREK